MDKQRDNPTPHAHHETPLPTPQSRLKHTHQFSNDQHNAGPKHEDCPGPHFNTHLEIIVVWSLGDFSKS